MNIRFFAKASIFGAALMTSGVWAEVMPIKYRYFTIYLDCDLKSAVAWSYVANKDTNNFKRSSKFYFDQDVPARCQQTSQSTYKSKGVRYDRGHLLPANAMDFDKKAIKESNYMTNVLPQASQMNRGAWLQTERYVECHRDESPVTVYGGVYFGETPASGDFRVSHGIKAPTAFWKVAFQGHKIISWWIPNSPTATAKRIDDYLVSVEQIEERANVYVDVPAYYKSKVADATNAVTQGCHLS